MTDLSFTRLLFYLFGIFIMLNDQNFYDKSHSMSKETRSSFVIIFNLKNCRKINETN